jgi:hypothetical protein
MDHLIKHEEKLREERRYNELKLEKILDRDI